MNHIVKIGVGKSGKAAEMITALGYRNRYRPGFGGGYVVSVDREDAPAFMALLKEESIGCQYIKQPGPMRRGNRI